MRVDPEILTFLWKWKLVSATALAAKFFPHLTNSAANMRLEGMKNHKLIYPCHLNTQEAKVLWALTIKGFQVAKEYLPELAEDGFRSEHPLHDFYVTAFHLGEWLQQTPENCDLFSEQELRRLDVDDYPAWVPKNVIHRPDGYWRVSLPEGMGTMAVEVELKLKSKTAYGVVAKFYRDQPNVFRVVWLARTKAIAKSIRERLQLGSPDNIEIHTFVLLEDFIRCGWQASILFGYEKAKPLSHLFGQRDDKSLEKYSIFSILDTRKTPYAFAGYTALAKSSILPLGTHSIHPTRTHQNPISEPVSLSPSINQLSFTTQPRRKNHEN